MQRAQNDELWLVITNTPEPGARPSFQQARTRTFTVTTAGSVLVLTAPRKRAMLLAVEQLPPKATTSPTSPISLRIPLDLGTRSAGIWAVVPDHLGASERSDGLSGRSGATSARRSVWRWG